MNELRLIQQELKIGKNQTNEFGGFNYRSCEDILAALKPHLDKHECFLTLNDDLVLLGDRIYLKAVATITNKDGQTFKTHAFAREQDMKKGMDAAQITGSASSYARKYALNGLLLIDDTNDADTMDNYVKPTQEQVQEQQPAKPQQEYEQAENRQWLNEGGDDWDKVLNYILDDEGANLSFIMSRFKVNKTVQAKINDMLNKKKVDK